MQFSDWWSGLQTHKADFLVTVEERISRRDFAAIIRHLCGLFDEKGLSEGDRLLILLEDEVAAIAVFCAALMDGLVPVMLAPQTPSLRCAALADNTEARAIVTDRHQASSSWISDLPAAILFTPPETKSRWFRRSPSALSRMVHGFGIHDAARDPLMPTDEDSLAYLLFTSGTTSAPSGVMISRKNIFANVQTIARLLDIGPQSRVFNDMVLAHADGLVQGPLLALASGCTLIRSGGFSVDRLEAWLNRVRSEMATHFITVPTIWTFIDRYAQHDDYFSRSIFIGLSSVAATLHPDLWQRLENRFGRPLTNQYGLTETVTSALYAGPHPEAGERFSNGVAVDCLMRIAPVTGIEDSQESYGELQIKGDNIFMGYWRDESRTQAVFTKDNWLRTGDLARMDANGNAYIVGRIKRIIIMGGFLIRPEEIDEALQHHPHVADSVTIAYPDEIFGEIPVTLVESAEEKIDEATLLTFLSSHLEPLKLPKRIFLTKVLPRGPAGKPQIQAVENLVKDKWVQSISQQQKLSQEDNGIEALVLQTAARVFRMDVSDLSLQSSPENIKNWDSFQQITFVLALEEQFALHIPTARAAAIRNLSSAVEAIQACRGK